MTPQGRVPRLSVVVPVYGAEAYLRDCLDSVLRHEGGDVEVIAVDDASPDGSADILDEYTRRDPRLRLVRQPENLGPGPARNAGLERATGEYVWFVDCDDWLPDGAIRAVVDRVAGARPDVLIVDHAEVFGDGTTVPRRSADVLGTAGVPDDRTRLLLLAQSGCTKVVRRAYLDEIGLRFPPGWYEDVGFSHLLLTAGGRVDVLDRVCYCYRRRDRGSITTSVSDRHFDVFDQYDRAFAGLDPAGGARDEFRPALFRAMVDHYLVIVGLDSRLPAGSRRAFFSRMASDYRRHRPDGFRGPGGLRGVKYRLVRHDAYGAYAALRWGYRAIRRSRTL